ncbi:hypothetical protein NP233_g1306 [Leucocoprinus birnbaumii]|uniref:Transcriptional coactivator p15 (PC4) C-terminal domain-containing protein n=1 Tax=Leucocoprinus birnbaumii TaxID=56174 RepID=A0AAD5W396_9AGAR|nr:hypothetical protein NP233_g1306 [Leucocoprinus birnbaumii]
MVKRKAGSDSEDEAQFSDASSEPKQKVKPAAKKAATDSNVGTVQQNNEGDKYIDLGKKKRATVRAYKEIPLLDIREFYGPDEKPGKKGISLTIEQWQVLRANADSIDELFSNLTKKGQ